MVSSGELPGTLFLPIHTEKLTVLSIRTAYCSDNYCISAPIPCPSWIMARYTLWLYDSKLIILAEFSVYTLIIPANGFCSRVADSVLLSTMVYS